MKTKLSTAASAILAVPLAVTAAVGGLPLLAESKIDQGTAYLLGTLLLAATLVIPSVNIVVKWIKGEPVPVPTPQPLLIREAKEVATKDDLEALAVALETRWEKRFSEQTRLTTDELHRLASAMQNLVTTGHDERESIHLRMNPLVEVTAHMRGQLEILVANIHPKS